MSRRLLVVRHGKSDWTTAVPDHDRPLNARGKRSAIALGAFIGKAGKAPDRIVTSTALRARRTAHLVAEAAGWDAEIVEDRALYSTTMGRALDVIGTHGHGVDSLMVVGHQPAWGHLVQHLTGADVAMKTGTAVALDTDTWWTSLRSQCCAIAWVVQPRLITD